MVSVDAVIESCASIGENIAFQRSINISPNPNNGQFKVEFTTEYDGKVDFELLSTVGTKVFHKEFEHTSGINTWNFDQQNLAKGLYLFNIQFEGKNYTSRIVVE